MANPDETFSSPLPIPLSGRRLIAQRDTAREVATHIPTGRGRFANSPTQKSTSARGAGHHAGKSQAPDEIRKKLYQLKKGTGAYRIVDLGNLNSGIDLDETYVRLSEVCRILLEHNVLPIILGGTHDLDYGQYWAYERLEKLVSLLNKVLSTVVFLTALLSSYCFPFLVSYISLFYPHQIVH